MRPVLPILFAVVGVILDAVVTDQALRAGRTEANQVLRRILGARPPIWAAIAWRAIVVAALVVWVPIPAWGWIVFGACFYAAAARNFHVVWGGR